MVPPGQSGNNQSIGSCFILTYRKVEIRINMNGNENGFEYDFRGTLVYLDI